MPEVPSMLAPEDGYAVHVALTIGDTIEDTSGIYNASTTGNYTPVGVIDGMGAYAVDLDGDGANDVVRVLANHELLHFRGSEYELSDGDGGTYTLTGARISYFDIDIATYEILDAGLSYNLIVDGNGEIATDGSFQPDFLSGLSRFCSGMLIEPEQFGDGSGLVDRIYFAGEEDGGAFNPVGGAEWALDVETGTLYHVPAMGRGAWENITQIDTGNDSHVAFILADDSSPFDFDGDGVDEAAPLFMYVGERDPDGAFLARNGLEDGTLYVWVPKNPNVDSPAEFHGRGNLRGDWVEVDNTPRPELASEDGSTGYDEYGYPTQGNLWLQARDLGAFGFSRPEDVATNPEDGSQFVLASTGVDTYDIDPDTGNGVDTFGTLYTMSVDFNRDGTPKNSKLEILYDGDADTTRALRSPDNLDWAVDGMIYVQEDEAEEDTASGDEVLFGDGATNPNEAGIVVIDPDTGEILRIANIDRDVVLDGSLDNPEFAFDTDAGSAGEWESSGILDVSELFGLDGGLLFLASVQAHGIEDQTDTNPDSRINDGDLVEGGQLVLLADEFVFV